MIDMAFKFSYVSQERIVAHPWYSRPEIDKMFAELRLDISNLRGELKTDIANLRTELKGDIADLRTEVKAEIAGLRGEMKVVFFLFTALFTVVISGFGTLIFHEFWPYGIPGPAIQRGR